MTGEAVSRDLDIQRCWLSPIADSSRVRRGTHRGATESPTSSLVVLPTSRQSDIRSSNPSSSSAVGFFHRRRYMKRHSIVFALDQKSDATQQSQNPSQERRPHTYDSFCREGRYSIYEFLSLLQAKTISTHVNSQRYSITITS